MDISDAINIMTYAAPRQDGSEGYAIWHIYKKDVLDNLRAFLHQRFDKTHTFVDPVHSQLFYLDSTLRRELFDAIGVVAHRIYQYPTISRNVPN
ncbi:hypothetical protein QFC21_004049 [Naganishia friedmannii]|uniref:Uncharacterized protein n=1 Tax=Naganishia friedmannii TaxID=89922 RepID=A0ACC2VJ37_9TREE|nr:hypothetical protein QFC21_004049 [Naganishia friedmannii]